ncbi:MAG TPA: fumarate hydratase [Clostridia bacterium]|nr:fumarate hydratase [Clostridia bacterium]HPQ46457.1 fumarate hydratase [Clostridia bacterium]HRX42611.1 fumarate hydratase [Clostridia bacterium]
MRKIDTKTIRSAIERMCIEASYNIPEEVVRCYYNAAEIEESPLARGILGQIIENAEYSKMNNLPSCQDTGMVVVFLNIGREVHFTGSPLEDMVNEGVASGYEKGYLRKSVVAHPIDRVNTGSNTPAVIHYDFTDGDKVHISLMPKGFGSENMSALAMLKPSDGIEGVRRFVLNTVDAAGANACPPLFIGIGIGGTAEKAMLLSKKALMRSPGTRSENKTDAGLEADLIDLLNKTGIGAAGTGGTITVFDVFVESFPTHIAGLPVAVNICCHAMRHKEAVI